MTKECLSNSVKKYQKYICLVIIGLIVIIPRLFMLGTLPKWDGGEYYNSLVHAVRDFDYTLSGFWDNFRLCGHPTLAISVFAMVGEILSPGNAVGVQIINLVLTVLAMFCLYSLFRGFFSNMNTIDALLATIVCSVFPLYLGTFSNFYPDYYTLTFLIFLIYAFYKEHELLQVVWGVCLSQTKETGMLFLFLWILCVAIKHFCETEGNLQSKIKESFKYKPNYCSLVSGLSVVAYIIANKGMSHWQPLETEEQPYWGVNVEHICVELKELFGVNFIWGVWLCVIVCTVILIRKKKITEFIKKNIYVIVLLSGYFLFVILYVGAEVYRYHLPFVVFLIIFCLAILYECIENRYFINSGLLLAFCVIFVIQTYTSIDPIMKKMFFNYDIGNGKYMVSVGKNHDFYSDNIVYNYQYTWIDKSVRAILNEIGYSNKNDLVILGQKKSMQIAGNSGVDNYLLYWDDTRKIQSFIGDEDDRIRYISYELPDGLNLKKIEYYDINTLVANMYNEILVVHYKDGGESYTEGFKAYLDKYYNCTTIGENNNYGCVGYELYEIKEYEEVYQCVQDEINLSISESENTYVDQKGVFDGNNSGDASESVICQGDVITIDLIYAVYNEYPKGSLNENNYQSYPAVLQAEVLVGQQELYDFVSSVLVGKSVGDTIEYDYTVPYYDISNPFMIDRKVRIKLMVDNVIK